MAKVNFLAVSFSCLVAAALAVQAISVPPSMAQAPAAASRLPGPLPAGAPSGADQGYWDRGLWMPAGPPPPNVTPVTLTCAVSPSTVTQGQDITVTATGGNVDHLDARAKEDVIYTFGLLGVNWSGNGVSQPGNTVTIHTTDLKAGKYVAGTKVEIGPKGREGMQPWQIALCRAEFTVTGGKAPIPQATSASAAGGPPNYPERVWDTMRKPYRVTELPNGYSLDMLKSTMVAWRAEVGDSCITCHTASKDPTFLNEWGAEEVEPYDNSKPVYKRAQEMFKMTEELNKANFSTFASPVTCGTCHRGKLMPEEYTGIGHPGGPPPPIR